MFYQKELFGDNYRMNEDTRPMPYSLRLEPDTRARLEALAKKNGRSLNAQIIIMLESLLYANGKEQQIDEQLDSTVRRIVREELAKAGKG
ncbi:MAG: hypothetical protein ACH34X_05535 [Thiolinea sp.]